ncbi:BZ3500_MvSof-1268-A1-R1_Chr6-1g08391 [Microbotryum saponariae]|uniref:mannan endo-1,4-beta-mannosidase n=1 Tax=Microbotryum saponariae TaxID=289078 RepID=A0A2X0MQ62_9BASI|nr:BZ3500_MvSof-1268-A1-R1_Chr6-1g08391 [Microbotryum saponariae]SDA07675.1 BZ3501_MvSof-1269-A2-R1_Chr6-1g08112 [Microbotryum saponariae]
MRWTIALNLALAVSSVAAQGFAAWDLSVPKRFRAPAIEAQLQVAKAALKAQGVDILRRSDDDVTNVADILDEPSAPLSEATNEIPASRTAIRFGSSSGGERDAVVHNPLITAPVKRGCAPVYSGSRTTIKGTGTLPKPTTFVQRSGQALKVNGGNFRIVGTNIYWLCNDENVGLPKGLPTDKGRVREALAAAVAFGANTVRLTTCATSLGSPTLLQPIATNFADEIYWDIHDYVLFAAREYGLRVVLPLTDNEEFRFITGMAYFYTISYDYYHGGKYTFLRWKNLSSGQYGAQFFTNSQAWSAYMGYVRTVMNRRNKYSRVQYKNDPTILAWETGNELGAYFGREGYPPQAWTGKAAGLIKGLAPNTLVIDGTDGLWNYTTGAIPQGGKLSIVDIVTDHVYPRNWGIIKKEISIAQGFGKNFLLGEFDWTDSNGGDSLSSFLAQARKQPTLGALVWNMFAHDAQCCNYVTHNEPYSIYYPNCNSASDQEKVLQLSQFFYKATGRTAPRTLVAVACPQPVF